MILLLPEGWTCPKTGRAYALPRRVRTTNHRNVHQSRISSSRDLYTPHPVSSKTLTSTFLSCSNTIVICPQPITTSPTIDCPRMKLSLLSLSWSLSLAYTRAESTFSSSGPPSACPGFEQTNETTFDVSFNPDNSSLSFQASRLSTIIGNATFSFALYEDGEQVFLNKQDPCLLLGGADLCPAAGSPASMASNIMVLEQFRTEIVENLSSAKNVTAQLWVDVRPVGNVTMERTACVQITLRSDDESGGESNSTSSTGAGASSDGGNSTSDGNNEESSASVPQFAFSLVM